MKAGYVGLIGKTNVGKSSLMNALIKERVGIVCKKPHTTRSNVRGILTQGEVQTVFVDTPGILRSDERHNLEGAMQKEALAALAELDVVVWVVDSLSLSGEEEALGDRLCGLGKPVVFALNKVDTVKDTSALMRFFATMGDKTQFAAYVPISAKKAHNLDALMTEVTALLPDCDAFPFDPDAFTDASMRFMAKEFVREQLMRHLGDELPYGIATEVVHFVEEEEIFRIHVHIFVEAKSQKPIVIGDKGEGLKRIGTLARQAMERAFGKKVYLNTWVRVRKSTAPQSRSSG